jgi:hypothetical protein
MVIKRKKTFLSDFRRRHSLRIHMSAILLATAFSGVLASKLFLAFSVGNFIIRYPLAVLFSYLVFFVCIKLWLLYVSPKRTSHSNLSDWLDVPTPSSGGSTGNNIPSFHGGGGEFDGAGASASFDLNSSVAAEVPISTISEGTSSVADGAGDVVGEAAGAIGEGGIIGIVVLVVLSALIATILGSAVFIFSEAPMILSEAAFEGLLAASLVKKTRIIDDEDWIGSIFKTTWRPFAITLAVAFFAALILHSYFPGATKLSDILK